MYNLAQNKKNKKIMFKGHPKGLITASLANLGERFGFYTMMAILVLFLQAKFGLDGKNAGIIYSVFYFSIYMFALVGGIIADKIKNYKGTILAGLVSMTIGYVILALPSETPVSDQTLFLIITCFALFIIAFGNGLFKGNLQALVGQMYDNPKYTSNRDSGFSLFYMFINVGAIFAPFTAVGVRNWWLSHNGFLYNADLPDLCHQQLSGAIETNGLVRLGELATKVSGGSVENLTEFSNNYLDVFTTGFHYAFTAAIIAMLVSLTIYLVNKKSYPAVQKHDDNSSKEITKMDVKEVKQRMSALFAVFAVVIFFWFSFHQNGLTLTFFARDYTLLKIGSWEFSAEIFQSVNPFFVVFLTPVIMGLFSWLKSKGMEPSTPKKIAIGMFIAALGYVVMTLGSLGVPSFAEKEAMGGLAEAQRVTPWLLIGTYLILTIAELFISPLGISFVSKVAPPQYQGIMQGAWLGATALGNQLLFIGAILYEVIPIWLTWSVFVAACLISMFTMLFMVKWLERIAK